MANKSDIYSRLAYARKKAQLGKIAYYILKFLGVEIPLSVVIGKDLELAHGGFGVVIHPNTIIGDRVKIYPGVTTGRSDVYQSIDQSAFEAIIIENDVILSSGAKVLCSEGTLRVRKRSVIGANAVLLNSTGEGEIWAGIPAKLVGHREIS